MMAREKHNGIRDTRMIERAIRERWNIPADRAQAALNRQFEIACGEDDEASIREQTSAFRSIIAAMAQNQKDEHKVIDVRVVTRNDDLSGIALELGIDIDLIEAAARDTDIHFVETEAESQPADKRA